MITKQLPFWVIYDGFEISLFRKQACWVFNTFRMIHYFSLIAHMILQKNKYVYLYSYFLFMVNLD